MRPVCVQCKKEMCCSKTGAYVSHDNRIWSGDQFRCDSCGAEVVINFGTAFIRDEDVVYDSIIELGGSDVD